MPIINNHMFFLGNYADLDPNESNGMSENAAALIGTYANPPIIDVAVDDINGDNQVYDDESGVTAEDFTYDTGSGSTSQLLDSTQGYNIRVLLGDGTTSDITAIVIQMQNGDVFLTDFGNGGTLDNLNIQSIDVLSVFNANYAGFFADSSVDNSAVVCFTPGALIDTRLGPRPVETLRAGVFVRTLNHGFQQVRWVGRRTVGPATLAAHPNLRPVVIRKGALGNVRRLLVSPQHGFLIDGHLVRAKHLAEVWGGKVARVDRKAETVTYIHFLCDRHEIVFAEGIATESLYPGPMALHAMSRGALAELMALFPDLVAGSESRTAVNAVYGQPACPYRTGGEMRQAKRAGLEMRDLRPAPVHCPPEYMSEGGCIHTDAVQGFG